MCFVLDSFFNLVKVKTDRGLSETSDVCLEHPSLHNRVFTTQYVQVVTLVVVGPCFGNRVTAGQQHLPQQVQIQL